MAEPATNPSSDTAPNRFHAAYGKYMAFVAVVGNAIFYIQAYKIFASESAKDVSGLAFAFSFWAVSSWFVYGLIRRDRIIIVANIVAMIGAALVLLGVAIHG